MTGEVQNAAGLVNQYLGQLSAFANQAFATANNAVSSLANVDLPAPPGLIGFAPPSTTVPELDPSGAPEPSSLEFQEVELPAYEPRQISHADIEDVPDFDLVTPELAAIPLPTAFSDTAPEEPELQTLTAPTDVPAVVLPVDPLFRSIELPPAPVLSNIEEFTVNTPMPPDLPAGLGFTYAEADYAYEHTFKQQLVAEIGRLFDLNSEDVGIPDIILQALFEQARERDVPTTMKAVQEATEEWSSRGFTLPQGELAKRIDEVRARAQDAANRLSREVMIQAHNARREDLRFAVQQAVAYEAQLISLHNESARRALDAARASADIAAQFFNLKVAVFNAQITQFNAEAELYRLRLQRDSQRIEVYRGQLEAAQQIGNLNEQEVRLYSERVRAQNVRIESFRARVEAFRAQVEGELGKVQLYRGKIEGFVAKTEAKRAEFAVYGEQIRAEGNKVQLYQASVQGFAERVRAISAKNEATLARPRFEIDLARLDADTFRNTIDLARAQVEAQTAAFRANTDAFEAQSRAYAAKLAASQAVAETGQAAARTNIEAARAAADVAIANARLSAEAADRQFGLVLEAQKAVATISAQLSAGAMSALNVSAGLSASGSYGEQKQVSVSNNYNASAEADVADFPNIGVF